MYVLDNPPEHTWVPTREPRSSWEAAPAPKIIWNCGHEKTRNIFYSAHRHKVEWPYLQTASSDLETTFLGLAKKWKNDTRNQSSISSVVMHAAYLDIIGLGESALPFILRDLQKENNHWFVALRAIAKTSPIKSEDAGKMKNMREAWLKWGMDNGYLP
jgi:hypothetical protein